MINPVKAEVRIATLNELGADAEDFMEEAQKRSTQAEGGSMWLGKAVKGLDSVVEGLNSDLKAGKVPEKMDQMETVQYVKKHLEQVRQSITDLAIQATSEKIGQASMAEGHKKMVEKIKGKVDSDILRLEKTLLELKRLRAEQGDSDEDPRRPRTSDAARDLDERKAQAKAEKAAKASQEAGDAQATKTSTEASEEPQKPKRARKKATKKKVAKKKTTKTPRRRSERKGGRQRGAANP